jgi:hypothetical protein
VDLCGIPFEMTGPPVTDFFIVVIVFIVFGIYFLSDVGEDL